METDPGLATLGFLGGTGPKQGPGLTGQHLRMPQSQTSCPVHLPQTPDWWPSSRLLPRGCGGRSPPASGLEGGTCPGPRAGLPCVCMEGQGERRCRRPPSSHRGMPLPLQGLGDLHVPPPGPPPPSRAPHLQPAQVPAIASPCPHHAEPPASPFSLFPVLLLLKVQNFPSSSLRNPHVSCLRQPCRFTPCMLRAS